MKRIRFPLLVAAVITGAFVTALILPAGHFRLASYTAAATAIPVQQAQQQSAPTIASVVERDISAAEKQIIDVAEAMPADKFNFSPETLNIPGSDYKGVRSFAVEVKHVAASNWFIWSPLTGEKLPEGVGDDGNGPANKKTKAEIIKFLKDSFALGHRAGGGNILRQCGFLERCQEGCVLVECREREIGRRSRCVTC